MNLNDENQKVELNEQPKSNPLEGFKGLLIGACVLVFLIGASAFALHLYHKNYMSNSKNVYEMTIKNAIKTVQNAMENYENHSKMLSKAEVNIESDMEPFKSLSGYTYMVESGIDYDEKALQFGITQKNLSDVTGLTTYVKNNNMYLDLSTFDSLILLPNVEENDYAQIFEAIESANIKDYDYLITQMGTWISNGIQADKIEKSNTNITVSGKNVKVTAHKYLFNDQALTGIAKSIRDGILNDQKALKLLAELTQTSESQLKQMLEESKPEVTMFGNDTDGFVMNIYTSGSENDVIGMQMTSTIAPGEFHYYANGKEFELAVMDFTTGDSYEKNNFTIIGTEQGKVTNVSVKLNSEELATLVVRESSSEKVDFDYQINLETPLKGTVTMNKKESKNDVAMSGSISLETTEGKIKLNLNETVNWDAKIADIDPSKAKQLTDEEFETVLEEFIEKISESPIFSSFVQEQSVEYPMLES